jgi:sec-independent protein translocase protein TatB
MFGLSIEKIAIVLVVAAFIIGPQRLPEYAAKLAQFVKTVKSMADGAKDRITSEMGPEFQDTDWKKLDPRQYDPRRIIRSALLDDEPMPVIGRAAPSERKELPGEDFREPAA